jgi:hypothetical protein
MNQLHRGCILLMSNVCCDRTYVLVRLAVRYDLLHWICASELVLKQRVLLFICFHVRSVWKQHRP